MVMVVVLFAPCFSVHFSAKRSSPMGPFFPSFTPTFQGIWVLHESILLANTLKHVRVKYFHIAAKSIVDVLTIPPALWAAVVRGLLNM